jgi:hypothetical protein
MMSWEGKEERRRKEGRERERRERGREGGKEILCVTQGCRFHQGQRTGPS